MSERLRFVLLLACFVLSGLAGLIYQTAWSQELALVFGTSEPAVAAVLAAYMAGLALGAALAGRWQHRVRRPVLLYAVLELGIGAAALAVPLLLAAARRLQVVLLGGLDRLPDGGGAASTLFYLVVAFAILLIPTTLMGATLPLLARTAITRDREIGPRIAWLYTANTVGAAAGTLIAAFLLLPRLGLGPTVWVAVALNGLVFVLAAALAAGTSAARSEPTPPPARTKSWILPVILVSGAVSFTYEVLWSRLLTHVLGGSVYAFGTMLATFLVGIALGSAAAARLATDGERARVGFAWAQIAAAGLSLLAFLAVDRLPELARELSVGAASLASGAALAAIVLLPSTLAIGATFPFAVRILARGADDAAAASARVYAWNTVGAIVGAIGSGFVLLPVLGFAGTVILASATGLVLAAVAGLVEPRRRRALAVVAAGLLVVAVWPPANPWQLLRHSVLQTALEPGNEPRGERVYHGVGRGASVLLVEQPNGWRLTTNGLPESVIQAPGSRPGRFAVTRWLSLLPLAVRPETRTMMVVGLGAGNTVEYLPPSLEQVSVVELEAEVVAANRFLAERRAVDPLADPRVRLVVNDARGALLLTEERFDAIVSQPSHPWTAGASHLFTRELFTLVRDRLTPDGVFLQWIGLAFVDEELIRILVATLGDVFAEVEVYRPTAGALLFVASDQPLDPARSAETAVRAAPREWGLVGVLDGGDVLAARVLDTAGARAFAAGAPLNTDRRNLLKTRSPRVLGDPVDPRRLDELFGAYDPLLKRPPRHPLYLIRRLIRRGQVARAGRLAASLADPADRQTAQALVAMARGDRQAGGQLLLRVMNQNPGHVEAFAALALQRREALTRGRAPGLEGLAVSDPAAAIVEGWRLARSADWAGVRALESRLAAISPRDPFYVPAVRLRANWRRNSGEPALAAAAIELLDPLLVPVASTPELALRAELAVRGHVAPAALASLVQLSRRELSEPLERRVRAIFESLPAEAAQDPRFDRVAARLAP